MKLTHIISDYRSEVGLDTYTSIYLLLTLFTDREAESAMASVQG